MFPCCVPEFYARSVCEWGAERLLIDLTTFVGPSGMFLRSSELVMFSL
jgi:hypothetical protein